MKSAPSQDNPDLHPPGVTQANVGLPGHKDGEDQGVDEEVMMTLAHLMKYWVRSLGPR